MNPPEPKQKPSADHPRRLCIVIGGFPPFVGGGERHAVDLAREWVRQGHQVTVLTRKMKSDWPAEEELDGIRIRRIPPTGSNSWGKYALIPFACGWLSKHRGEFDLVLICAFRVLGWVGIWAKWMRFRVWMRAEAQGEWSGDFLWGGAGRSTPSPVLKALFTPYILLRNLGMRSVDALISISRSIRSELEAGPLPPQRILDIPNGLDTSRFHLPPPTQKTDVRQELGLPEDAFVWVTSGKLIKGKGLEDLLDAWKEIHAAHPTAHLLLIGSGSGQPLSCEQGLKTTVEARGWSSRVHFTGFVNDVARYLSAADAYVFPSHKESFGLAPLEAMAVGLPVLATRNGGVEEFIEDGVNGRLVEVQDVSELAAVMQEWMQDLDATRHLAETGARSARERFGMPKIAHLYLEHLEPT